MNDGQRRDASGPVSGPGAARRLAEQFAAHLRHLREFRGVAYVSAAPSPRRTVEAPAAEHTSREAEAAAPSPMRPAAPSPGEAVLAGAGERSPRRPDEAPRASREIDATWSSGQAPGEPRASAHGWPERQVESAPPAAEAPARSRPALGLPIADAPRPAERAEPPRPAGDTSLRAQAQAWTPAQKLAYLRTRNLGDCTRCKLAKTRANIVFGVGDPEARLMFVGEAPGADEDRRGEPFVGAAGRRLTQWIERLGMRREQVYIANVLKCRPPGNREPAADEVEKCSPFLRAQIRAIRPEVLVALGRHAGMLLIDTAEDLKLAQMRNQRFTYADEAAGLQIPLYITYHPSYVIRREGELPPGQRNPADDTVMGDLERALRVLRTRG